MHSVLGGPCPRQRAVDGRSEQSADISGAMPLRFPIASAFSPRDLKLFCGLSFVEIAEMRQVSERTVQCDWAKARVLLHHALSDDEQE